MVPRSAARPLALAAVVLTAIAVLMALWAAVMGEEAPFLGPVLAAGHLGELAAAVAVVACGAAGRGALTAVGLVVTALGELGLATAEITNMSAPDTAQPIYAVAPILSGIGMVVLGAAVLRARVWEGALRALPLLVGLWMLVVTIPVIVATGGPPALLPALALAVWDLLWLGTALGVLATVRAATPRPTTTVQRLG
ncbi:hypothetical protein GCM10023200_38510 [Actinomycetospora chlora]|uniref:Uncharacterized protein n=1 Tax=Actinomycetospora chlora TaxID=663608 RepID=A0ABP9BQY1_9PSEU